jgi:hypothetical protein
VQAGFAPSRFQQLDALTITGANLMANGADPNPTVNVATLSLSCQSPTACLALGGVQAGSSNTQLLVGYTVNGSPSSTGQYGITVTTNVATSNKWPLKVGDPTPVITSVSALTAGTIYTCSILIRGSGFGTNPTLSMVSADGGNEIASFSTALCAAPSDTLITASVTTTTNYAQGAVNVSVTSQGYTGFGSGFLSVPGDSSSSNSETVEVAPDALPAPQIMLGTDQSGTLCATGTNVVGTPQAAQSVVVGQQIAFTGCPPSPPPGGTLATMSWSPAVPQRTAIGGYNVAAGGTSAAIVPLSPVSCGITHCDFPAFYWVDQGASRQFTFSYTLSTGAGASATISFNVAGPTATGAGGTFFTATPNAPASINPTTTPRLALGIGNSHGIDFSATATFAGVAAGANASFIWVQLRTMDQINEGTSVGTRTCVPNGFAPGQPNNTLPELDVVYPYPINPAARQSLTTARVPLFFLVPALSTNWRDTSKRRCFCCGIRLCRAAVVQP